MRVPRHPLKASSGEAGPGLAGATGVVPLAENSLVAPEAADYLAARVERIEQVTPRIKVFTLVTKTDSFQSRPGQWVELAVPSASEWLVGRYSMVSAPRADGRVQLAIKYAERHSTTRYMHERCREGDTAYITCGQGDFVFCPGQAERIVLLGAGIGVAPLVSILRFISAERSPVSAHLVYSAVAEDELLFKDELAELATLPNIDVTITITGQSDGWQGRTGRINDSLLDSLSLSANALYYFCGTRDFVADMRTLIRQRGVPEERLRYDKW